MRKRKHLSRAYVGLVMAFLYLPIVILIVYSFNASKSRSLWTGFTLDWYKKLFSNEMIVGSLLVTLAVAVIASVVATVIGTLAAIGISNMKKRTRSVVMNMTYVPILNPEIVTGVALMLLFVFFKNFLHFEFGLVTLALAHITFCTPYVILNVMPKLRQMDKYQLEAAADLGCNPRQTFFKVVIPEIMPGIIAGFLMAFTYSLDDFIISYFTSGPTTQPLSVTIFSMTRRKVSPEINALSTIIFVVVLLVLLIMNIRDARKEQQEKKKRRELKCEDF
ncbi:ABC transporter permease [Candidatus Soleaferrea massiliensis]|uniref:ABC transporter permease n=1 Tax=Candidatus Soleaferrea massiliensis TaxID=1470354 RepID=UPI00058ECC07|nr:ABC transporter permease [Candidatus Soleaferrea massiliensis]